MCACVCGETYSMHPLCVARAQLHLRPQGPERNHLWLAYVIRGARTHAGLRPMDLKCVHMNVVAHTTLLHHACVARAQLHLRPQSPKSIHLWFAYAIRGAPTHAGLRPMDLKYVHMIVVEHTTLTRPLCVARAQLHLRPQGPERIHLWFAYVIRGAPTHAGLRPMDLKSIPLATRAE